MKHYLLCALALVALVATVRADDEKKKAEPPAPDSFKSLSAEFSKMQRPLSVAFRAAKTDEEREKILAEFYLASGKLAERFLAFAKAKADDPKAYDALVWIIQNDRQGDVGEKAATQIVANHLDNPMIKLLCQRLSRSDSAAAKTVLRAVAESSEDVDAQAHASYGLAKAILGRTGKRNEEAEALLARVIKDYPKVDNGKLATTAERDLYEVQNFSIGSEAPEITSEDIDGVEFKLTDYRGKIVVLDFWGNW